MFRVSWYCFAFVPHLYRSPLPRWPIGCEPLFRGCCTPGSPSLRSVSVLSRCAVTFASYWYSLRYLVGPSPLWGRYCPAIGSWSVPSCSNICPCAANTLLGIFNKAWGSRRCRGVSSPNHNWPHTTCSTARWTCGNVRCSHGSPFNMG